MSAAPNSPEPVRDRNRGDGARSLAPFETLRRAPLSALAFALAYGLICAVIAGPDLVPSLFR